MVNHIRRMLTITAGSALVVLLSSFGSLTVNAAGSTVNNTPNGFTVSPILNEITVNKGQSQTIDITVENPANQPLIATPVVNDFVASNDESGSPRLILKPNSPLPANNFESLVGKIASQTITPNGQVNFAVTISVPESASSGGYYGAVRFVPGNIGQSSNVGLSASVGSLVIVTVPGNLTQKLDLVQLSAAKDGVTGTFFSNGNLSVITRLDNTGNIQAAPFGSIVVKNSSGKVVSSLQLNNQTPRGLILPDSVRKFTNPISGVHFLGHYTIIANLGYGDSGQTITASVGFWYIPVWFMILVAVIVVLIVAMVYWIYRNIHKRKFSRRR